MSPSKTSHKTGVTAFKRSIEEALKDLQDELPEREQIIILVGFAKNRFDESFYDAKIKNYHWFNENDEVNLFGAEKELKGIVCKSFKLKIPGPFAALTFDGKSQRFPKS